ncbi:MAG TPA: anthrone oxygenase family protein [Kofleriaceae bacterium]|jgi:uncharacterized membrane protein|nr:anthrone oxygenase family protein [Kofleriaceae bacterium]
MSDRVIPMVTLGAALGCGLVAGVFFAFSSFVMPALGRLPAAQGILAMQAINLTAVTRWLMAALLGTAAACLVLAISSLVTWSEPGARLRLAGCILYLAGTILLTRAFHIPRNDALAAVQPDGAEAARLWARYLTEWTAGNHVRTAAALVAALLLILSLLARDPSPRG